MKSRHGGFTLIELLIVIVVMMILMMLAVVAVSSTQAQARDKERENDIAAIARGLEQRYIKGNPVVTAGPPQAGTYPGVNEIRHAQGVSISGYTPAQVADGYMTKELPGTTTTSLLPPGNGGYFAAICSTACGTAGNTALLKTAFGNSGTTYKDAYVYEPIDTSGNICTDACIRFNLYWISETDKTTYLGIPGLKVVGSKHR